MISELAARLFIVSSIFVVVMAFGMWFLVRYGYRFPGGIHAQRDSVLLSFPVVTSITLSVVLTVLLNVVLAR